jgi:prevent-host-death family protein
MYLRAVMKEIGAFEAKNKLAYLLDLAEKGEEIIITRHGKQVARLGSLQKTFDRQAARQAAEAIQKMSKGMKLGGIAIRELIEEGRM